ncbi:uncharacterized protein [Arachis hypogaea]|uniref:uncharacterized protein n=1 Tax=Arachis hypogaea TaxID=3818 RepID=UPI003B2241C6
MEEAQKEDRISGLRIAPTAPTITHLLFADDCIIFAKAKEEEAYQIITVLNEYTEASGQRINLDKSGITFGHQVSIQTRVCIEEILNMSSCESLGKYLGLPAIWGRSINRALSWIEERILNKLEGWKERLLNQAGKEILIKAVMQAIPAYAMNVIKFSKQFCKRINSRVARFWWATSGKERAWRALKNPYAIWVKILQAVYYPKGNFWEAQVGKNSSWIWKSILHGRELLRRKGKWSVGNGSKINIWMDNWIAEVGKVLGNGRQDNQKVEELIEEGRGWNESKIRSMFLPEICDAIIRTPISFVNKEDNLYWPARDDGIYTIKTGYFAAKGEFQSRDHGNPSTSDARRELWKEIWKMKVPSKIKSFLWKAAYDIVPVNSNLFKKRIAGSPICQICTKEVETTEHALLLCEWTRAAWFGADCQCIPTTEIVTEFGDCEKEDKFKRKTGSKRNERGSLEATPADWIKANVDASFKKNTGKGAIAVVYRDNRGKILLGFTGLIQANSVTIAEALAIRQALIIVNNLFMEKVLIESDNLKIIQAIKSKSPIGEAWAIIQDIQLLLEQLSGRGITWTPREGNLLAHKVAREAELGNLHSNWSMQPSLEILRIMHNESKNQ